MLTVRSERLSDEDQRAPPLKRRPVAPFVNPQVHRCTLFCPGDAAPGITARNLRRAPPRRSPLVVPSTSVPQLRLAHAAAFEPRACVGGKRPLQSEGEALIEAKT